MKVRELIERLNNYDGDKEVAVLHPKHNYIGQYEVDNLPSITEAVLRNDSVAPENWQEKMRCDFEDDECMECVVIH